ncbi:uncharacterized protein LOC114536576 [Dendronephthya gigantea]|uniref:uncharacterized protein LOC114536576 n=1 Tax=Dendronephthya gigantea TaxID=151771 RepID=UPI00106BBE92|nr:uncharacterized protein LOC114536576 [Dendronephthya gigantea]
MESTAIRDSEISASSNYDVYHRDIYARLNHMTGYWTPAIADSNPWLQIDFKSTTTVDSISTQGAKTFTVSYGDDGVAFTVFTDFTDLDKIFPGDYDLQTTKKYSFFPLIEARYVRVNPQKTVYHIGLRVEFHICAQDCFPTNPCQNTGNCVSSELGLYNCVCPALTKGTRCETCSGSIPLGMESGDILDAQITSSPKGSRYGLYNAKFARLNQTAIPHVTLGGWSPTPFSNSYLEIDFTMKTTLTYLLTQGKEATIGVTVTKFKMTYTASSSRTYFSYISTSSGQFFYMDANNKNITRNDFQPMVIARYVRFYPLEYNIQPVVRMEFYGCMGVHHCLSYPCLNNGTCSQLSNGYNCICVDGFIGSRCQTPAPTTSPPINYCLNDSCLNNGTCRELSNGYDCNCVNGFTGSRCQNPAPTTSPPIKYCLNDPCLNNGTCRELSNGYDCNCVNGFTGSQCQSYVSIAGFALNPLSPQEFAQSFTVVWNMTAGTNVTIAVSYNGIPCCNAGPLTNVSGQCDCLVSDPGHFDPDGVVNISAVASNLLSSSPSSIEVEVLKIITQAGFTALASYSDFGVNIEGRGSQGNIFPAEHPVKFNCSYAGGPVTTVTWTINCDTDGMIMESQCVFDKIFPNKTSQTCQITLRLENVVNSTFAHGSIELMESVVLSSLTSDGPVKENQTITFTISLEKLGTQTCIWVDLGDNSSLLVFGNDSCATKFDVTAINPNILTQPRFKFLPNYTSNTQEIVFQHVYPDIGSYDVRMNASNEVSMVTKDIVAVVLPFVCHNPNVTIKGLPPNTSNALNAAQVYRSVVIALSTQNDIDCETTEQTKTTWTVLKFDDDPRELTTLPIYSFSKSPYHSSIFGPDLLLPGNDLPYGFYEISARVEMRGLPDVFGSDTFYIQVVQTPWLEAAVVGGSFYTAPFGLTGILNSSASSDPDFTGTDGMNFAWYCRDVEDKEFVQSNLTSEPLVSDDDNIVLPITSFRGCFGSGRGRIDTSNSTLVLDTSNMMEMKTYEILLVVSKTHPEFGLRQAMTTIFFYVTTGLPPTLTLGCSKNCQSKITAEGKTIMRADCSSFCQGELMFNWTLHLYDDIHDPEPLNLSALHEISSKEFQNMVRNPINELDLSIKPDALQPGKKYTLAFRATRPSGIFGEVRTTLLVNGPPLGGTCSVTPSFGISLSTNFTFACERWSDHESPLTYKFFYGSNQSKTLFYYRTIASGVSISHTDRLPAGEESNNYTLSVSVEITDAIGSSSFEEFLLRVVPSDKLSLTEMVLLVAEYAKLGENKTAMSLACSVGTTLNSLGSKVSEALEAGQTSDQIREDMLTIISGMNPKDLSETQQISDSVVALVGNAEQLTEKAQDAALTTIKTTADELEKLTQNDMIFKNAKPAISDILWILGALNSRSENKTEGYVKRIFNLVEKLQVILLDYLVSNEGPSMIETEMLSMSLEKVSAYALGKKESELKGARFKPPSGSAFGLGDVLSNPNKSYLHVQPIAIELTLFDKNPFTWDNSSENVTSNVIDIVVESKSLNMSSSNLTEDITLTITRDPSLIKDANNSFYLKPLEILNERAKKQETI